MFKYMRRGRAFYRDILVLALPMILQNLIMTSLALADTFMVGLLGEAPMAAVTLANAPVFVIDLMVFGLMSGSQVLISQFWGKQDKDSINRVIGIGFMFCGFTTMLFSLVCIFIPHQFMSLFSNNADLVDLAAKYLRYAGPSYVFHGFVGVYVGANRGMENPKIGLYIFGVSVCINTFLNWILIFGKLGAPAMGVEGAALATFISRVCEFIIMVVHMARDKHFRLDIRKAVAPGKPMLKKYIKYSTPVVFNETMWGLGTALYPTIMGHMENSKEILAAFTIAGNIEKLCTVAVFGVAASAATIVGREIGRGNKDSVYQVGQALGTIAFLLGLMVGAIMIGLIFVFIEPVMYPLFKLSPMAQQISTMMLLITFIFIAPRGFNSTNIVGILRGGGDVRAAALIDTLPLWLVALPMAAICGLVLQVGVFWVSIAMVAENIVKFIFGMIRFHSKKWINDLTIMEK